MPWCDDCQRFWNPNTMPSDGACPTCGRVLAPPRGAPWHFKLLLAATALYLAFRLWEGIVWLAGR
jgi:hypothetical protein